MSLSIKLFLVEDVALQKKGAVVPFCILNTGKDRIFVVHFYDAVQPFWC